MWKKLSEIYMAVKIVFLGKELSLNQNKGNCTNIKDGKRFDQEFHKRRLTHDQLTDQFMFNLAEFMFHLADCPRSTSLELFFFLNCQFA